MSRDTSHRIEVVRHLDLTLEKPEALRLPGLRRLQRHHFHQRLAALGNHEWLAIGRLVDQARQMSPRLMDVDGLHGALTRLSLIDSVNSILVLNATDDRRVDLGERRRMVAGSILRTASGPASDPHCIRGDRNPIRAFCGIIVAIGVNSCTEGVVKATVIRINSKLLSRALVRGELRNNQGRHV